MYRKNWGGVLFAGLFFNAFLSFSQIRLISSENGKPVKDAIVNFSGIKNEQHTSITDSKGMAEIPGFKVLLLQIVAEGYKPVIDTLKNETTKTFSLIKLNMQIKEVVITGQYHPNEASNTVYDVTVFDQKNITLRAANNLGDLLQHENGILISRDPFLGVGININGISGNNVKILQDGVPIIGRENGNIDISQIDLSNIERVELVRGPMSETYGSDALAGVINLISKKKVTEGVAGGAKLYYETNGTFNLNARAGIRQKNHEISLNAGRNFFDGFSKYDTLRSNDWKPKEQYIADLGYTFRFKNGYIRYLGNIAKEKLTNKGNVIATPYEAYAFDDYYNTNRSSHKLFIDFDIKNHSSINFTNSYSTYQRSRESFRKNMVTLKQSGIPGNNSNNSFNQYLFRGTYSTFKSWKKINYQAGYDISLDQADGDRTGSTVRKINDFAVFGSMEIMCFKKLLIRPAIRAIYNSKYPAPFVPSLHIKYDFFKSLSVRASLARGFRAPSVKELYLDFEDSNHNLKGNTDLKPELSDYAQLSFDYTKHFGFFSLSLKPDGFINHIYNKIALAEINNNTLEYTYINIEDYRNFGGNFNINGSYKEINIMAGINMTAYRNSFDGSAVKVPYSRSFSYNASLSYNFIKAGLNAGLFFKHTGMATIYSIESDKVKSYFVNDYNTMDFTLGKTLFRKKLTLSAGIKNIFNLTSTTGSNSENTVHGGGEDVALLGMGRYYFGGIIYNFGNQ